MISPLLRSYCTISLPEVQCKSFLSFRKAIAHSRRGEGFARWHRKNFKKRKITAEFVVELSDQTKVY